MGTKAATETATLGFDESFDQAFEQAKQEHAAPAEKQSEEPPETGPGETETATEQPAEQPQEGSTQPPEEPSEETLLSSEEEKLTGKAREKAMNRAFTQKTQQLAQQRKELDAAQQFLDSLEQNPQETLSAAAERLGFRLVSENQTASEARPAAEAGQAVEKELSELIGPELAQKFSSAIRKVAQEAIQPITQTLERREIEAEVSKANSALEKLKSKYPDAVKFDKQMAALGKRFLPADGTDPFDYLEGLYFQASRNSSQATASAKAANRIIEATKSSEQPKTAAAQSQVKPGPPPGYEKMPFDQQMDIAAEAAKRGEVWD